MDPITIMLIIAAIASLASAGAGVASSAMNVKAQKETNAQNVEYQKEVNEQQQYNLEHAHQIEMADLEAAGLNPVLTATGGNGAPMATLNAPRAQAPQVDLSGVSSAMSGMMHMATMAMMMNMKTDIMSGHDQTLAAIANSKNAQSAANAALRADTLNKLYQRKASTLGASSTVNAGKSVINSAKNFSSAADNLDMKSLQKLSKFYGIPLKKLL